MHSLLQFIESNSYLLFDHSKGDAQTAMFDSKGFRFSPAAASAYDKIKSQPHLYVAWNESKEGHYYIGKSFQQGGRWKRTHAYHLGTLAYHLLETTRYDDQNHQHWIDAWMVRETLNNRDNGNYSIQLQEVVRITFIPFHIYHDEDYNRMSKKEIRNINTMAEFDLINHFKSLTPPVRLLNVQNNTRKTIDKKLAQKEPIAKMAKQEENQLPIFFRLSATQNIHQVIQNIKLPPKDGSYSIRVVEFENIDNVIYCTTIGTREPKKYFSRVGSDQKTYRYITIQMEMTRQKIQNAIVMVF